jgi:glycosyltransferase involved in cell wall biosynthesis
MHIPSVSVVIPCYNQAHWVGEAIESVQRQHYDNCEIIVVNDGSPDNITEIMSGYPTVRLLNQTNQGLSVARNEGLRLSRGDYVVFLDADDRLLPSWLDEAIRFLEAHPLCAFVYGHAKLIAADGESLETPDQPPVYVNHYEALLHQNYIWTPGCVVYRRTALDAAGNFNVALRGTQDFELHLRISRQFPIQCLDRLAVEYRKHGTSITGKHLDMMFVESMAVLRGEEPHVAGKPHLEAARRHGFQMIRQRYGEELIGQCLKDWRNGEWRKALRTSGVLLRHYPTGLFGGLFRRIARRLVGKRRLASNQH